METAPQERRKHRTHRTNKKMVAFLKHKVFNLEVVSCTLYLVGVTKLDFFDELLGLKPKTTASYLTVNT